MTDQSDPENASVQLMTSCKLLVSCKYPFRIIQFGTRFHAADGEHASSITHGQCLPPQSYLPPLSSVCKTSSYASLRFGIPLARAVEAQTAGTALLASNQSWDRILFSLTFASAKMKQDAVPFGSTREMISSFEHARAIDPGPKEPLPSTR